MEEAILFCVRNPEDFVKENGLDGCDTYNVARFCERPLLFLGKGRAREMICTHYLKTGTVWSVNCTQ